MFFLGLSFVLTACVAVAVVVCGLRGVLWAAIVVQVPWKNRAGVDRPPEIYQTVINTHQDEYRPTPFNRGRCDGPPASQPPSSRAPGSPSCSSSWDCVFISWPSGP